METHQTVNARAREEAAAQLERRGLESVRSARDLNRAVLKAEGQRGKTLTFVVKAKTSGTWQGTTNDGDPEKSRSDVFWVFVDLGARPTTEFFVVPDQWIRQDIQKNHSEYLAKHGGRRAMRTNTTHHAIQPWRVQKWKDRWDLVCRDRAKS